MDTTNRTPVEETGAASQRELLQLLVASKPGFTEEEMLLPDLDGEQLDGAASITAFFQRFLAAGSHRAAMRKIDKYLIDVCADGVEDLEDEEIEELSEEINDFLRFPAILLGMMHEIQTAVLLKAVLGDEATLEEIACAVNA